MQCLVLIYLYKQRVLQDINEKENTRLGSRRQYVTVVRLVHAVLDFDLALVLNITIVKEKENDVLLFIELLLR